MSKIKQEIIRHMSGLELTEAKDLVAHFVFPEDFIGFQGHFPLKKILPGVCQIQCVMLMLEQWEKRKLCLREIVQAKFLSPVSPLEKITCVCRNINTVGDEFLLNASINRETQKVAELKLKLSFVVDTQ